MLQKIYSFLQKDQYHYGLLLAIWMLVQLFAYFHFGTMLSVDTVFYVENARLIREGVWALDRSFWYMSYSSLLAAVEALGGMPVNMAAVQVACAGLALCSLYRLAKQASGSAMVSFIAGLLYISWMEFHQWALIIYTDSLFTSSAIISISLLYCANHSWQKALALLLALFTIFIRPAGLGFFVALMAYFIADTFRWKPKFWLIASGFGAIASYFAINWVMADYIASFIDSYAKAEVIYPNIPLFIEAPEMVARPKDTYPPVVRLGLFILYNPWYFFKLSLLKFALFVGHIKPYYSNAHNFLIGLQLYPLYGLAIIGARHFPSKKLLAFSLTFIAFQAITVSLTSENWDGRFLLPILPWVFLLASASLWRLLKQRIT